MDPAFAPVLELRPDEDALAIWRIEKMEVVSVPESAYGKFYTGDSYIVFRRRDKETNVHFWLGKNTSQDEAGAAAIKTVELDDSLGGHAVQHREVQGRESKRFLSYFKSSGLYLLDGGVASGFNHVEEDKTPKLFVVKGKRQPMIVRQLSGVGWGKMNAGDVFILDTSDRFVFVWTGKDSNRYERFQAAQIAQEIKNKNGGERVVIVMDGDERDQLDSDEAADFSAHLPFGDKGDLGSETSDDESEAETFERSLKLYRIKEWGEDSLDVDEVKTGPLSQDDLKSDDSFVVDHGRFGIWIWIGKGSSKNERTEAMKTARGFAKKMGYDPDTARLARVVEHGEPTEFKALFGTWKDAEVYGRTNNNYRKAAPEEFDARTLHDQPALASNYGVMDNGKGAKEVFRVESGELKPVPEDKYGTFYSGDCYVVSYSFNDGTRNRSVLYYWLGADSAQDERGNAAYKTVELDEARGGKPVQVRIVQGKEPAHFLSIFNGKFKILSGGIASKFDGDEGAATDTANGPTVLQIHGKDALTTKCTQVGSSAESLNTNDCFLVYGSDGSSYLWLGRGSTDKEKEIARGLAAGECSEVAEGEEDSGFWGSIGGEKPYITERAMKRDPSLMHFPCRLFLGSNASGGFRMEEIFNFGQTDLVSNDVMMLDVGDEIFVWIGDNSNEEERKGAMDVVAEYLKFDPANRDPNIPVTTVREGEEPANFIGFFGPWDYEWKGNKFE